MADGIITGVGGGPQWDQSFSGAGIADSAAQTVKAIQSDDMFSAVASGAVAGLDVLGLIANPVDAIGSSVVGWILDHLWFLDGFLDFTTGDPAMIEYAATVLNQAATDLDQLAADQITALAKVPTYLGGGSQSSTTFTERVEPRGEEIKTQSLACLGLAEGVTLGGLLVSSVRGIIRDLLADFTWKFLKKAAIAVAAAPYTGGNSIAALVTDTIIDATNLAVDFGKRLTSLATRLTELSTKLARLVALLDKSGVKAALPIVKNAVPAHAKATDSIVGGPDLNAADQAEHETEPEHTGPVSPDATVPAKPWHTSGTLDE